MSTSQIGDMAAVDSSATGVASHAGALTDETARNTATETRASSQMVPNTPSGPTKEQADPALEVPQAPEATPTASAAPATELTTSGPAATQAPKSKKQGAIDMSTWKEIEPPLPRHNYTSLYANRDDEAAKHPPAVIKRKPSPPKPRPGQPPASAAPTPDNTISTSTSQSIPPAAQQQPAAAKTPTKPKAKKAAAAQPQKEDAAAGLQETLQRAREQVKQRQQQRDQERLSRQGATGHQPQGKRLSLSTAVPAWLHQVDAQYKQLLPVLHKASEGHGPLPDDAAEQVGPFLAMCCTRGVQLTDDGQHEMANAVLVRAEELSKLLQTLPACELTGAWMAQRAAVLNNLGYYFRARNKLDDARRWLQQARKLEVSGAFAPEAPESTLLNLGAVLSKLGQHQQALEQALEGLAILEARQQEAQELLLLQRGQQQEEEEEEEEMKDLDETEWEQVDAFQLGGGGACGRRGSGSGSAGSWGLSWQVPEGRRSGLAVAFTAGQAAEDAAQAAAEAAAAVPAIGVAAAQVDAESATEADAAGAAEAAGASGAADAADAADAAGAAGAAGAAAEAATGATGDADATGTASPAQRSSMASMQEEAAEQAGQQQEEPDAEEDAAQETWAAAGAAKAASCRFDCSYTTAAQRGSSTTVPSSASAPAQPPRGFNRSFTTAGERGSNTTMSSDASDPAPAKRAFNRSLTAAAERGSSSSVPELGGAQQWLAQARLLATAQHNVAVELEHLGRHEEAMEYMGSALQLAVVAFTKRDPLSRQFAEEMVALRKRCAGKLPAGGTAGRGAVGSRLAGSMSGTALSGPVGTSSSGLPQQGLSLQRPGLPSGVYQDNSAPLARAGSAAGQLNKASHSYIYTPKASGMVGAAAPAAAGSIATTLYPDCLFGCKAPSIPGMAASHPADGTGYGPGPADGVRAGAGGRAGHAVQLTLAEEKLPGLLQQELAALGFNRVVGELSPLEQAMLQRSLALEAARRI